MVFLWEYLRSSYLTLFVLSALMVMLYSNRKVNENFKGIRLIYVVTGLTFLASVFEFLEVWCDDYQLSYRILYYKSAAVYILYPLIALLVLYLTEGVKQKLLVATPLIVCSVISLIDIADTRMIYYFRPDHSYDSGPLHWVPFWVEGLYLVLLIFHSLRLLRGGSRAQGAIVMFMASSCFLLIVLIREFEMPNQFVPMVVAMEVFIYYFYLSAIEYRQTQLALAEKKLEAERNKSNLLMAQIRPHLINNNLARIRNLIFQDPNKAVDAIDHFSEYLQETVLQVDDMRLIPFEKEMKSVDNYLYLEKQWGQGEIRLEKNLEVTEFGVPPLSIQALVENAVCYGLDPKQTGGTIKITTASVGESILITVEDDGVGFDVNPKDFDGVSHVGIKNVMDRFASLLDGEVTVESKMGTGTKVSIKIPEMGMR